MLQFISLVLFPTSTCPLSCDRFSESVFFFFLMIILLSVLSFYCTTSLGNVDTLYKIIYHTMVILIEQAFLKYRSLFFFSTIKTVKFVL